MNGQERSGTVNGQERSRTPRNDRVGTVNGQERIVENGHCTVTVRSRDGHGHASKLKETLYMLKEILELNHLLNQMSFEREIWR